MYEVTDVDAAAKQLHDELLQQMPEGAAHDAAVCPLCKEIDGGDVALEGGVQVSTFSKEELEAAVAEAVEPLNAKITELSATHEQAEIEAKIEEAKTPLQDEITELQAKLDAQVLETEAAKTEHTELVSLLETSEADRVAAEELASRRDERVALVKEVASFPEEHITANADRWASMDQAMFEAALEDWKLIGAKAPETKVDPKVPAETAMLGGGEKKAPADEGFAAVREVMNMSIRGFDPRTV